MDDALEAVRKQLERLLEPDQRLRVKGQLKPEAWNEQHELARQNVTAPSRTIETYGWPTERVFGEKAALAAFLVLQNAPSGVQERYLLLLQAAAERGEVPKARLAFLTDRIRYRNEPQLYGTQLTEHSSDRTHGQDGSSSIP